MPRIFEASCLTIGTTPIDSSVLKVSRLKDSGDGPSHSIRRSCLRRHAQYSLSVDFVAQ
jgi:hypothetical protein